MSPTSNPALRRSLRALGHPLTIGAVILLLLNDHLLRVAWPSWWTGKLGDFAWLAFFPLVLALPLSLLVPARMKRQEAVVAALSFGITGLMFTAMKTIPAAMDAGLWLLHRLTGGPFILRVDPTDLLTLPALLIAWWVWRQAAQPASALRGWVILALGAFASLANTPIPNTNIDCILIQDDGTTFAGDAYFWDARSTDGGLTWDSPSNEQTVSVPKCRTTAHETRWEIADPAHPEIHYRLTPGQRIERSADGGSTWSLEKDVSLTEAQAFHYRDELAGAWASSEVGPFDAAIHPQRGTLILAMGFEGILTRAPDGSWHWQKALYQDTGADRPTGATLDSAAGLLWLQIWLAIMAAALVPGSLALALPMKSGWRIAQWMLFTVLWAGWAWVAITYETGTLARIPLSGFVLISLAATCIIWGLWGGVTIQKRMMLLPLEVWIGMLAAPVLFMMPYVFWIQRTLPYRTTMAASLILVAGVALSAEAAIVRRYRREARAQ